MSLPKRMFIKIDKKFIEIWKNKIQKRLTSHSKSENHKASELKSKITVFEKILKLYKDK